MRSIKKLFAGLVMFACAFAAFAMPVPAFADATESFQITSGNTTHYAHSLYDAITAADDGSTITLLESGYDLKESTLAVSKNLTLDLNGYGWATKSTFTISGSLTIEDTSSNASGALAWNDQIKNKLFAVADNGKLTITGGKFGGNGSWTVSDSGSLVISGGKFQSQVDSKYLSEGAVCAENTDSDNTTYAYKVTKDGTSADGSCKVTDADGNPIKDADGNVIVYKSLADALANAPEGAVITVNKDVVLDSTVKIPNSITIDLDGHKVSTKDGSACIEIADGKTVDIKDSGETKGSLGDIILGKNATANVAKDTTVGKVTAKDTGFEVKTTTNADGSISYTATEKKATGESGDGKCIVTDKDGNPLTFDSLEDALKNAPDGATVKLTGDAELADTVTVGHNITIDLDGHNLTGKDGKAALHIPDNHKVAVKNGGKLGGVTMGNDAELDTDSSVTCDSVATADSDYEVKAKTAADGSKVYKSSKKDSTDDNKNNGTDDNNGDDGEEFKANKAKLKSAIDAAKKIQKGKKSDAAWKALQDAITAAEAVHNNADASNSDVVSAITALANAEATFASSDDADSSDSGDEDNNSNKNNGTKNDNGDKNNGAKKDNGDKNSGNGDKNSGNGGKDNNNKSNSNGSKDNNKANGNGNSDGGVKKALPQTGDTTPAAAIVSFAGASVAALAGGVALNRRQRADARHMKR